MLTIDKSKKKKLIIIGAIILYLIIFVPIGIKLYSSHSDIIPGNDSFKYTVNSDGKTCTVTGLGFANNNTNIVIPSVIGNYTVTAISKSAFEGSRIQTVIIPSTITSIGSRAFANCKSLTAVYGLENCTDLVQISDYTFYLCKELNTVQLPPKLLSIGEQAFSNCYSLQTISFPDTLKTIRTGAFVGCLELSNIQFPDSITQFGPSAFGMCNTLTEVVIPPLVEDYEMGVFAGCESLTSILVPDNNKFASSINGVLYDKNKRILWCYPSGITNKEFTVPDGVRKLGSCSLAYNKHLETIFIPRSIKTLSTNVFLETPNLKSIYYDGTVAEWLSIKKNHDWNNESSNFIIYCTDGQISKDGTVTYN